MSTVARHIKKRRSELFMTQDSLAEQLFVTRQTVSNWETGRSQPDIDTLVRIAEVLKTDASALIYGPPQEPNRKGALWGLCISGGITLLLGLTYIIGMPIARELRKLYIFTPYILLHSMIVPLFLFALGWTLLQGLFVAGLLKPLSKGRKPLFFILLGMFMLIFLPFLAFNVEQIFILYKELQFHANPTRYLSEFSYAGVLPSFVYYIWFRLSTGWEKSLFFLAFLLFGIALWLTKPRNNPKETLSSNTGDNLNPTGEK